MFNYLTPQQAFLILNGLPHIGPISLNRLLARFNNNPIAILNASPRALREVDGIGEITASVLNNWEKHFNLAKEEKNLRKTGTVFVTCQDPEYPKVLKEIHDPPIGLYRKGDHFEMIPTIAIIGSRRTTLYGQAIARKLAEGLARAGFCIVSGLARGIDTIAHESTLAAGGKTAAVLGSGLDIIYPAENLDLYRKITETGAVFSEFPFGRRADRQTFPMRNRIVSGMSEGIIVVESDINGGSMITARFAGEQGRLVFAVPGRVDQPSSAGCHQLIRDGAILCRDAGDVLEELNFLQGMRPIPLPPDLIANLDRLRPNLSEEEAGVLTHFENGEALTIDRLAELTNRSAHELSPLLMMLELKKTIAKRVDGTFEATLI